MAWISLSARSIATFRAMVGLNLGLKLHRGHRLGSVVEQALHLGIGCKLWIGFGLVLVLFIVLLV